VGGSSGFGDYLSYTDITGRRVWLLLMDDILKTTVPKDFLVPDLSEVPM
jgi:hypothetical protein